MFELDVLPPGVRLLSNPEYERLLTKVPDLAKGPEGCVTCGGTGTFLWWTPDRDGHGPWKCNCSDQWALQCYLHHAGVPLAYQRLGWADVVAVPASIREAVEEYRDNAAAYVRAGYGLILHGTQGTGKTLLAVLLLKGLLAQGYSGHFTTFSDMINVFTQTWRSDDERAWFDKRIRNVTFLVVDDPGKEHGGARGSGLAGATFDAVLRHRVASGLPTIVTTNYGPDKVKEGYGDGILDLLAERARGITFEAKSFRLEQRERVEQEIKLGLTRPLVLG